MVIILIYMYTSKKGLGSDAVRLSALK
ncbi:ferrous iron transport protein A, partial [Acinetobacter nosocomialis]